MTNYIIDFAGLGLKLNPPAGFSVGPFDVRFYGLIIALGLVLAVVYALKRREQFGLSEDDLMDGDFTTEDINKAIKKAREEFAAEKEAKTKPAKEAASEQKDDKEAKQQGEDKKEL